IARQARLAIARQARLAIARQARLAIAARPAIARGQVVRASFASAPRRASRRMPWSVGALAVSANRRRYAHRDRRGDEAEERGRDEQGHGVPDPVFIERANIPSARKEARLEAEPLAAEEGEGGEAEDQGEPAPLGRARREVEVDRRRRVDEQPEVGAPNVD